jgi:hypothetical protein
MRAVVIVRPPITMASHDSRQVCSLAKAYPAHPQGRRRTDARTLKSGLDEADEREEDGQNESLLPRLAPGSANLFGRVEWYRIRGG